MIEQAVATILACVITGIASTVVAIINSNSQRKVTEQKINDTLEAVQKEYNSIKGTFKSMGSRLDELSETDSCCTILKDDVQSIKETITEMSAAINQLKADSVKTDALLMKTNMLQIRHTINESYRIFKEIGKIDKQSKDSLQALSDIYINDYHGNSFVEDEMDAIRKLPIE